MRIPAAVITFSLLSASTFAATTAPPAHALIANLNERMHAAAELHGQRKPMVAAERDAAAKLAALIQADPAAAMARNAGGDTPLIVAAAQGYPQLVAVLLRAPQVRAQIDAAGADGGTAWAAANQAPALGIFACAPAAMSGDSLAFIPVVVKQPYYSWPLENPYHEVRRLLEDAGAQRDVPAAKALWNKRCKQQSAGTRAAMEATDDVMETAVTEGLQGLWQLIAQLQAKRQR